MGKELARVPKIRFPGFTGEWVKRKLGDVAKFSKGSGYSKEDLNDYGTPIILYGRMYTKYQTQIDDIDTFADEQPGSVYSTGKEVITPASGETAEDISIASAVIKPGILLGGDINIIYPCEELTPVFLVLQISTDDTKKELYKRAQGKSIVHLHNADLQEAKISYPLVAEQQKISAFFQQLDNLIALQQRKLAHWRTKKQGLLQKMFPKPGTAFPELRFPGFTEPWVERKLGDIVEFLDGQRKPLEAGEREKGVYPYYGASGIIDYVKDYLFDEELILLSEDGANIIDRNYRVCFLANGKYWVNNHAHVMKARKGYRNGFICESLERLNYTKYNTGTAQPKLNQEICHNITLPIPSYEEQTKVFNILTCLDTLIAAQQRQLEHLQQQKKALLQQMFV